MRNYYQVLGRQFVIGLSIFFSAELTCYADESRPNVLFLLADDQHHDSLGCDGHKIVETPTIDRLANSGVRFENMFVTRSTCWASRTTILTGLTTRSSVAQFRSVDVPAAAVKAQAISRKLNRPGPDLTSLSPGKNEIKIKHDGQTRRLIVTTPKTYDRQVAYPVLFCFHGAGGKAEGQSARWSPQADKNGLIVISAEAVQSLKKWNFKDNFHDQEIDDVGFVSKVVEILIENKVADDKAIFATGHSSGGLFSWRLAKESDLFAAAAPMSCGMAKGAHDPDEKTKPIPVFQVIGDKDKSYNGTTNPKITMYSAKERIEIWRKFNKCAPDPVVVEHGDEITVYTYASPSGVEVVFCKVKDQEHHIRRDLRDRADSIAINFLIKHKRK